MKTMFFNGTSVKQISFAGPYVLLVHGLGLNKNMWEWQTKELSKFFSGRILNIVFLVNV